LIEEEEEEELRTKKFSSVAEEVNPTTTIVRSELPLAPSSQDIKGDALELIQQRLNAMQAHAHHQQEEANR